MATDRTVEFALYIIIIFYFFILNGREMELEFDGNKSDFVG